jgi:5'(3')-deoxyribonucleotidase
MNEEYILYLDMDGVLVDFDGGFKKITQGMSSREFADKYGEKSINNQYSKFGIEFWSNLEWIHGGKELWEASSKLFKRVNILSSSGTADQVKGEMVDIGKRKWIEKNIPSLSQSQVIIVNGKHLKPNYASKDAILVDDMPITIKWWNEAGGFGILHNAKHYKKTIEDLEDISRPISLTEIVKRFNL